MVLAKLKTALCARKLRKLDYSSPKLRQQLESLINQAADERYLEVGGELKFDPEPRFVRIENAHIKLGQLASRLAAGNDELFDELILELYKTADELEASGRFNCWKTHSEGGWSEAINQLLELDSGHPRAFRRWESYLKASKVSKSLVCKIAASLRDYLSSRLFLTKEPGKFGFHIHFSPDGPSNYDNGPSDYDRLACRRRASYMLVITALEKDYAIHLVTPKGKVEQLYVPNGGLKW